MIICNQARVSGREELRELCSLSGIILLKAKSLDERNNCVVEFGKIFPLRNDDIEIYGQVISVSK